MANSAKETWRQTRRYMDYQYRYTRAQQRHEERFARQEAERNRRFQSDQARRSMNFEAEQAQQQMNFQERMANTAHQREMTDLQRAGLNPILAAGASGAASPAGSAASGSAGSGDSAIVQSIASSIPQMFAAAQSFAQASATSAKTVRSIARGSRKKTSPEYKPAVPNGKEESDTPEYKPETQSTGVIPIEEIEPGDKPPEGVQFSPTWYAFKENFGKIPIIVGGAYLGNLEQWANVIEVAANDPNITEPAESFIKGAIERMKPIVEFYKSRFDPNSPYNQDVSAKVKRDMNEYQKSLVQPIFDESNYARQLLQAQKNRNMNRVRKLLDDADYARSLIKR